MIETVRQGRLAVDCTVSGHAIGHWSPGTIFEKCLHKRGGFYTATAATDNIVEGGLGNPIF
jgi:hypothetical protein